VKNDKSVWVIEKLFPSNLNWFPAAVNLVRVDALRDLHTLRQCFPKDRFRGPKRYGPHFEKMITGPARVNKAWQDAKKQRRSLMEEFDE
jgi:hypothetical protein